MAQGKVQAILIAVDPNFPNRDTFIPISAFANMPWGLIISSDTDQMKSNTHVLPVKDQNLRMFNAPRPSGGLDISKVYPFYRYINGPNPRTIGSMVQHGYDPRPLP